MLLQDMPVLVTESKHYVAFMRASRHYFRITSQTASALGEIMEKKRTNLDIAYQSGLDKAVKKIKAEIDSQAARHQVNGLSPFDLNRLGIAINQFEPNVQGVPKGTKGFPFL
jgi:hypothetical protein